MTGLPVFAHTEVDSGGNEFQANLRYRRTSFMAK